MVQFVACGMWHSSGTVEFICTFLVYQCMVPCLALHALCTIPTEQTCGSLLSHRHLLARKTTKRHPELVLGDYTMQSLNDYACNVTEISGNGMFEASAPKHYLQTEVLRRNVLDLVQFFATLNGNPQSQAAEEHVWVHT